MRLSNNEKNLLRILLVGVAFLLIRNFLYMPMTENVAAAKAQNETVKAQYAEVQNLKSNVEQTRAKLTKTKKTATELAAGHYVGMTDEEALVLLKNLCGKSGLRLDNAGLKNETVEDLGSKYVKHTEPPLTFQVMKKLTVKDVAVQYTGSYEDLFRFLQAVDQYRNKNLVIGINMSRLADGTVMGNISMTLCSLNVDALAALSDQSLKAEILNGQSNIEAPARQTKVSKPGHNPFSQ